MSLLGARWGATCVLLLLSTVTIAQPSEPNEQPLELAATSGADTTLHAKPEHRVPLPVKEQQPKRILGVMPNYRAVSAGAVPPPPGRGIAQGVSASYYPSTVRTPGALAVKFGWG